MEQPSYKNARKTFEACSAAHLPLIYYLLHVASGLTQHQNKHRTNIAISPFPTNIRSWPRRVPHVINPPKLSVSHVFMLLSLSTCKPLDWGYTSSSTVLERAGRLPHTLSIPRVVTCLSSYS